MAEGRSKDCLFLVSYIMAFGSFIIFIVAFCTEKWISYDNGYRGLWKECTKTNGSSEYNCAATTLAQGPIFLDASRSLLCFSLVFFILGVYGYCVGENTYKHQHTLKYQCRARIQEISYFISGFLGAIGSAIYGINFYNYHANDLQLKNIKLSYGFYLACISTGMAFFFSIIMCLARETGVRNTLRKKTRSVKLIKSPAQPQATGRLNWLKNKKTPTPLNQKNVDTIIVETEEKEVPVKTNNFSRFIIPVTVMRAAQRLKKGKSDKEQKMDAADGSNQEKEVTMNMNTDNKYKGIFTINVDNRNTPMPPVVQSPPRIQINKTIQESDLATTGSSETESYTDSSSTDDEEIDVKIEGTPVRKAERVTFKDDEVQNKGHISAATESEEKGKRPKVRRSLTNLPDGEEPEWTRYTVQQSPERPTKPRRTMSHGPTKKKNKSSAAASSRQSAIPESNVNIYSLPSEPGIVRPSSSIDYEEVIVSRGGGDRKDPKPVVTSETRVYKPYS